MSNRGEGTPSDTPMFPERAQALRTTVQPSPTPRSLVADAKLSNEDKAATLQARGFLTRLPHTRNLVSQVSTQARRWATWQPLEAGTRSQRVEGGHDTRAQRGLVVWSHAACARAAATVTQAQQRAAEAIDQPLLPVHAQRFATPRAATAARAALATPWRYPQVDAYRLVDHQR